MIVLDTTLLIDALRHREPALKKIAELEEIGETLCTTQINVLELFKGAYIPARSEEPLKKIRKLLSALVILSIDEETYECFAAISLELRSCGRPINDFDELIAAITMINGALIVTKDEHFRQIPGLRVISY